MSVTTSIRTVEETLQDYKLHLSAFDQAASGAATLTYISPTHQPKWPCDHRRIPPYRPINKNLDLSERPNGSNKGELVFVTVMMNGVRLQAVLHHHFHLLSIFQESG